MSNFSNWYRISQTSGNSGGFDSSNLIPIPSKFSGYLELESELSISIKLIEQYGGLGGVTTEERIVEGLCKTTYEINSPIDRETGDISDLHSGGIYLVDISLLEELNNDGFVDNIDVIVPRGRTLWFGDNTSVDQVHGRLGRHSSEYDVGIDWMVTSIYGLRDAINIDFMRRWREDEEDRVSGEEEYRDAFE